MNGKNRQNKKCCFQYWRRVLVYLTSDANLSVVVGVTHSTHGVCTGKASGPIDPVQSNLNPSQSELMPDDRQLGDTPIALNMPFVESVVNYAYNQ